MSAQSVMPFVAKTGTLTPQTQPNLFHLFTTKNKIPSSTCALNTITNKVLQFQSACHVNCHHTFLLTHVTCMCV